jgi:hypothetical protein
MEGWNWLHAKKSSSGICTLHNVYIFNAYICLEIHFLLTVKYRNEWDVKIIYLYSPYMRAQRFSCCNRRWQW